MSLSLDILHLLQTKYCDFETAKSLSAICRGLRKRFLSWLSVERKFYCDCYGAKPDVRWFSEGIVFDYERLMKVSEMCDKIWLNCAQQECRHTTTVSRIALRLWAKPMKKTPFDELRTIVWQLFLPQFYWHEIYGIDDLTKWDWKPVSGEYLDKIHRYPGCEWTDITPMEKDIALVMSQVDVSVGKALTALHKSQWDIVDAILELQF